MAKSFLEVENARLNKLAIEEGKKRARVEERSKELKHELFEAKTQLDMVAQESVEAYNASKECAYFKRNHALSFYHFSKDKVRAKVVLRFLML